MRLTLCGSTRFLDLYRDWNARLSKAGHVVYSVAVAEHGGDRLTDADKDLLDLVHLMKIQASDAIFVLDGPVDGKPYVGASTRREIAWARLNGKGVFWFSNGGGARLLGPFRAAVLGEAATQPDMGLASIPAEEQAARTQGFEESLSGRVVASFRQDLRAHEMMAQGMRSLGQGAPDAVVRTPDVVISGAAPSPDALRAVADVGGGE